MGCLGTKKPHTVPPKDVRVGNWHPPPTRNAGEVKFQSDLQSTYIYTQPSMGAHKHAANHSTRPRWEKEEGEGGGAKGADQSVPRSKKGIKAHL